MRNYTVDLPSLHEAFPPDFPVPTLLLEFAEWIRDKPVWSLGDLDVQGARLSDHWAEEFSDLSPNLVPFLHMGEGSLIAFWRLDPSAAVSPPVVLIGSEGSLKFLADSLAQFLGKLAAGNTGVELLDPKRPRDETKLRKLPEWLQRFIAHMAAQITDNPEPPDLRPKLATWLSKRNLPQEPPARTHPDFREWFKAWQSAKWAQMDADPVRQEITGILREYSNPPVDAPRLWNAQFGVAFVGNRFHIHDRNGELPRELHARLEPLFRAERVRRAGVIPARGLWFSCSFRVYQTRPANLVCDFLREPDPEDSGSPISNEEYAADLRAFPRTAYWTPNWLREKLAT